MTEQQTIINFLASIWPESASAARIFAKTGTKGKAAHKAIENLENAKRIEVKPHAYFSGYRLTYAETVAQGVDMTPAVKGRTEPVYSFETYTPPSMKPARHDAEQAMQIMSRRGENFVPFMPPIHMGSNIPAGMA